MIFTDMASLLGLALGALSVVVAIFAAVVSWLSLKSTRTSASAARSSASEARVANHLARTPRFEVEAMRRPGVERVPVSVRPMQPLDWFMVSVAVVYEGGRLSERGGDALRLSPGSSIEMRRAGPGEFVSVGRPTPGGACDMSWVMEGDVPGEIRVLFVVRCRRAGEEWELVLDSGRFSTSHVS